MVKEVGGLQEIKLGEMNGEKLMSRVHFEGEDYHKAITLSQWIFIKYDMSYKTYRNKSKNRKDELKTEFEADTGADLKEHEKQQRFNYLDKFETDNVWENA